MNNTRFDKKGLTLGLKKILPFGLESIVDFECPIGVSNNGRFYLFKNKNDSL
jgi:hypothetical protein